MAGRERLFWALCVPGAALPLVSLAPWILREGLNLRLLVRDISDSPVGAMFGWDVVISALVLVAFMLTDRARVRTRHLWLPLAGGLLIGPSFGLPAFLALRERALTQSSAPLP